MVIWETYCSIVQLTDCGSLPFGGRYYVSSQILSGVGRNIGANLMRITLSYLVKRIFYDWLRGWMGVVFVCLEGLISRYWLRLWSRIFRERERERFSTTKDLGCLRLESAARRLRKRLGYFRFLGCNIHCVLTSRMVGLIHE